MHDPALPFWIFIIAAGALLFAWILFELWVWYRLQKYGLFTEALVVSIAPGRNRICVRYSFRPSKEPELEVLAMDFALRSMRALVVPGSHIGVRYDSQYPRISRLDHGGYTNWGLRITNGQKKRTADGA